jgi:hypothetical protein
MCRLRQTSSYDKRRAATGSMCDARCVERRRHAPATNVGGLTATSFALFRVVAAL